MTQPRERKRTFLAVLLLAPAVMFLVEFQLNAQDSVADAGPAAVRRSAPPDRSHFAGARACIDCHRSEYVSWLNTAHYNNNAIRLEGTENSIDTKYQALTGNVDLCYTCHALPKEERFGRRFVESGTSCESCHGAAGGEDGWLNRHAVYGPNVTRMEHESPEHREARTAACEVAGMVRSERHFDVAQNCLSCHIVGHPQLIKAGHKTSFPKFSLIPYMLGEVRHNFHMDQRHNARASSLDISRRGISPVDRARVYFIVEQLARMNVALTWIARLPSDESMDGEVTDAMLRIFDDAAGELEEFAEVLLEEENSEGVMLTEEQLAPLLAAVEVFSEFDELESPTRADAAKAAHRIETLAAEFEQAHDGRLLDVLDVEFLEDLGDPVGDALEP
jgi:hypothetical protein